MSRAKTRLWVADDTVSRWSLAVLSSGTSPSLLPLVCTLVTKLNRAACNRWSPALPTRLSTTSCTTFDLACPDGSWEPAFEWPPRGMMQPAARSPHGGALVWLPIIAHVLSKPGLSPTLLNLPLLPTPRRLSPPSLPPTQIPSVIDSACDDAACGRRLRIVPALRCAAHAQDCNWTSHGHQSINCSNLTRVISDRLDEAVTVSWVKQMVLNARGRRVIFYRKLCGRGCIRAIRFDFDGFL